MVFFEAPHRLAEFLADAAEVLGGGRRAAVSRELTKTYEETRRGTLAELASWAREGVRGEITVVIAGAVAVAADLPSAVADVLARIAAGEPLSSAVASVAEVAGVPRKALYQATLDARKEAR